MSDTGRQEPGYDSGYGDDYADDDDYYTYDATDEEDEGRRRPLVILAIVALLVLFGGVVFFAYKQGLKQGAQGTPPIIRADQEAVKVPPVNPGGIEIPHQDRAVYDRLSGSGEALEPDTERLLPRAEEPIPMAKNEAPVGSSQQIDETAVPSVPEIQVPEASIIVEPAPVVAAKPVSPAPAPTAVSSSSGAGGYVVQLAAFRDEPSARDAFGKLQRKYPALAAFGADIQRADLGDKGIYYRLRAGYMSKSDAQSLCNDLAAKGQACFVRTK
tara:strand:- start:133545 stop:134357 length:813 start_codon:yes stop_codon:yes gene_type:complete